MKATIRPLFGEHFRAWEVSASANEPNAYGKVLKRAARLVRDLDSDSVHVSGITWSATFDAFVLYVFASKS